MSSRRTPTSSTSSPLRRRDSRANEERLIEAALTVIAREGVHAPLRTIAQAAGVGIGTFYRHFPDRTALVAELQVRAYADLERILDEISGEQLTGIASVQQFLSRTIAIADRLVLPLRGTAAVRSRENRAARVRVVDKVDALIDRGRRDGTIRAPVNAIDVVVCSAVLTHPPQQGPEWNLIAARHVAIFVAGLANLDELPRPEVYFDEQQTRLLAAPGQPPGQERT